MPSTPKLKKSKSAEFQPSFDDQVADYFEPINRGTRIMNALFELHTTSQGEEVRSKFHALRTLKVPQKHPSILAVEERLEVYSTLLAKHGQQLRDLGSLKARLERLLLDVIRQMFRAQEDRELKMYDYVLEAILESIEDGEVQYLNIIMGLVEKLGDKEAEETQKLIEVLGGMRKASTTKDMAKAVKGTGSKDDPMELS